MIEKRNKSEEIKFTNPFSNDFELPTSKTEIINVKPVSEIKILEEKIDNNPVSKNHKELEKIQFVKIGFDIPKDIDKRIEFIALEENKKKKDLLNEIIKDWIRKRDK